MVPYLPVRFVVIVNIGTELYGTNVHMGVTVPVPSLSPAWPETELAGEGRERGDCGDEWWGLKGEWGPG